MNNRRSASVGALPLEKKHFVSRNESASGALLDVRCACQYFQCESLLPDRVNPVESRPTSKQGFVSDMEHEDHQHFDRMSTRSFNVMAKPTEFDIVSAASFGGRTHGMDGRGLVVRSISDATEQEMVGGMMAGRRGRQLSIGGMSSGSFGGQDPDTVSVRSGISLRRISRSPSRADLFVADLNIPTQQMPGQSRRGSKGDVPKLNIIAPTPIPGIGNMFPPDFSIYDRKTMPSAAGQPARWTEDNKENLSGHHGRILPQNKPIDVSRYVDRDVYGRALNEPMDVDIEVIEPVVDIKDNIRIERMSPPLQQNVPDLSPRVEDETKIEIKDFAPQPDLRPIDEILADEKAGQVSQSQLSQLKRQRAQERDLSPDYSKKQFMQRGSPNGGQIFQRGSSPARERMQQMDTGEMRRGRSPGPKLAHHMKENKYGSPRSFQRSSSPTSRDTQHTEGKQFMHYGSTQTQSFPRGTSPVPRDMQHTEGRQFMQYESTETQSFQRGSFPEQRGLHQRQVMESGYPSSSPFQKESSPAPIGVHSRKINQSPSGMNRMDTSQSPHRASSPGPQNTQEIEGRTFMQKGSPIGPNFQRASSPGPSNVHQMEGRTLMPGGPVPTSFQRAPSPGPSNRHQIEGRTFTQGGFPSTSAFQRASSPGPTNKYQMEGETFMQRGSPPVSSFQRGSSPGPSNIHQMEGRAFMQGGPSSFQRASSPGPFMQRGSPPVSSFQRASSPGPSNIQQLEGRALMQGGPSPYSPFQRASSPGPSNIHQMEERAFMQGGPSSFQRASSPGPFMQRGSPPTITQPFQKASSPAPAQSRQLFRNISPPTVQQMDTMQPSDKPHEEKPSYSSRFMSMFHSKAPEQTVIPGVSIPEKPQHFGLEVPTQEKRKLSIAQLLHIDRAPTPGNHLNPEPSPTPSRLMSVFKRERHDLPVAMSVVEGSHLGNVTIKKGPEEKLLTVKVTETFSLKVDEMDQYSSRPPKSPSPIRHTRPYASSEQIRLTQDKLSESIDFYGDRQEAFAPVVLSSNRSSQMQLQAGNRSHYMSSSQSDLTSSRRFDSREHIPPAVHPITFDGPNNKKLISVPIAFPDSYDTEMTSSEFIHEEPEEKTSYSQPPRPHLFKTPSEQRLAQSKLLQRKAYVSDRTQSQDRAATDRASELDSLSLSTRSMTKTVSFSFGEHGSLLGQHEQILSSNNQLDKKHWLERSYFSRDHEYEPIGEPATETQSQPPAEPQAPDVKKESSPAPPAQELPKFEISQPSPEIISEEASPSPSQSDEMKEAEELQKDIEDRYFSSVPTTPRTESQTDYDVHTSQVDSSALEELPLKPENRKKGFMASAQDRTRKMQAGLKNQAGKIKTKFRSPKKPPSGSPKAKERKRFKAPEFSKIKMPEMKRPDLSGFKRPEFTKFSKPDMSKFKLPDKFSSLKLTRSKSFKEPTEFEDTTVSGTTPESTTAPAEAPTKKQKFDFSFGTYPRAFRKKKKPQEVESTVNEPSVIPSTETQPSAESSSTPQGDRGPGPVRSRWADKFSDVSYNDSEGSRYRRYGSEQESSFDRRFGSEQESSFDRESSMERRMKEVLDENAKEEAELAMLGVVEQKQFADYDEENRVIHEISKTREGEFKRRPIVHQDSDLVSEEGRDIGWTEREAEKNRILRKAELEAEQHLKYLSERAANLETQSTGSSKKFVFEEINDDEFLLRKKGISQEFNVENVRFLDPHMEAAFSNSPNGLELIGGHSGSLTGSSIDRIDYGYDVPPPKPRRMSHQQRQRQYDSENASQIDEFADDISLSQTGSDYYRNATPARPLRKGRFKHSQEISIGGSPSVQFDYEEDYRDRKDPNRILPHEDDEEKENIHESPIQPPQAPRRRRKQVRDSLEKDSYANGFGGRSVSNSYLREDNKPEEVIVYRTEHEYKIPLATPETYTDTSTTPQKSRSLSRLEDDRTSHGADSINLDLVMRGDKDNNANLDDEELQEKYIIEMMENDGYAVVRKDNLPKPTPPARRKKFSRSPGERFATMPHLRRGSPVVPDQKPTSRNYSTVGRPTPPRRKSALSLGADSQKEFGSEDFNDYEVAELDDRTESPRNLQSGDIINKMKYRPLPPPPRPPREKRHTQRDRHGDDDDELDSRDDRDDRDGGGEKIVFDEQSSDDYNQQQNIEVEVSTQTDPLPDDFVCEEFEITEDMKIIEPRRTKTLDEILKEEEEAELERARQIDDEVLLRGIQRFREANQRSISEKSRASSQAKSLSRPQTPSAILIEKRVPTPVPNSNGQTVLEASLTVQPIDDLDLEEEILRREGLYDGSHSKSDGDSRYRDEEEPGHGSEEENARIGEEERSYTRSTDTGSQHQDEDEQEQRLQEQRLQEQKLNEQRLQEELLKRLQEEEDEEQRLIEELEKEQRLQEEEEAQKQKLLEEEEKERQFKEKEELKQRLRDELERQQRLRLEHFSSEDEQSDRLKSEDSHELLSEESEDKKITPPPTPPPPPVEEVISILRKEKLLTEPKSLEQQQKDQPDEEPSSPPPMAPPRKRSSAAPLLEDQAESLSVAEQSPVPSTSVMPSHLALADLEVERLRVHALQAGQIMVSHLHGAQIQADELECRSGNLVVRNIELPPGFIEDIVERVRSTEREHSQAATQTISDEKHRTEKESTPTPPVPRRQSDIPPVRPPPPQRESMFPSEYMQPPPSAPFYQLRDQDEHPIPPRAVLPTDHPQSVTPIGFYRPPDDDGEPTPPVYRRRRHHRRRDSSSEEDHQRHRSRSARPEPPTVGQAARQFISACSLPLANVINQLTNAVRPNNDNKQDQVQPRNISTTVVLFIVMTLSFLLYLLSGRNIHHHHWDYFNPPGNDGRLS